MALICLIHGSTQSSSAWARLVPELERRGHATLVIDLPGDEAQAGAGRYADEIVRRLDEVPRSTEDVMVVAHSVSGIFLPLVADRRPVRRVVYLAAFIPELGKSPMQQFQDDPLMFNPEWVGKDPRDDSVAERFLFHDCPPEVLPWALSTRRVFVAEAAMKQRYPLQVWPSTDNTYIVCAEDRTISPRWSRRVARERLGVEALELPGGHCPHVSRPQTLAETLDGVASCRTTTRGPGRG